MSEVNNTENGGTNTTPTPTTTTAVTNPNLNGITSTGLSAEMKTYYDLELITLAEAELVHDQFGQKRDIPRNGGKSIEFRQFDPLPEATEPLVEGVTPDGESMSAKTVTATLKQYGGYITLSDMVQLTAVDQVLTEATRQIASQAGRTLDTITREILNAGTVVQFADGTVTSRDTLHYTSKTSNCNLSVDAIRRAVRFLEKQDAPRINGRYVGIIHPDCKYDLMNDPDWRAPHQYVDTGDIYENEIGELYGVRFVESSRAKVFSEAGKDGVDVYSTLILGENAYGVTSIQNGGLVHIVKPLGSAGSADPLNQRGSVGWKAARTAEILVPQYMVRIESTATP